MTRKLGLVVVLMLAGVTLAFAKDKNIDAYAAAACARVVDAHTLECHTLVLRYRMVKMLTFTEDACHASTAVKRLFLHWSDWDNYRLWAAVSEIECAYIGVARERVTGPRS